MDGIWLPAGEGDLAEVQRLVRQDPGLLEARDAGGATPLMWASQEGHVGVVRWLLDKGAALDELSGDGCTALHYACHQSQAPVVGLLLQGGADPTIANQNGTTPFINSCAEGHLEVVRVLLGHPGAKSVINHRTEDGQTALWCACYWGHGGVARALLESGADPTIANNNGITPMAITKQDPHRDDIPEISAEGRRECVAALEVSFGLLSSFPSSSDRLADA
jgi:uncharacterized protein